MADELALNMSLNYTKSGHTINKLITNLLRTIAGAEFIENLQTIGTSNEAILFGDTLPGYLLILNTNGTNYVEIFGDDMNAELHDKLLAGDFVIRKLDGATPLYGRANTGACACLVIGFDL